LGGVFAHFVCAFSGVGLLGGGCGDIWGVWEAGLWGWVGVCVLEN